MIGMSFPLKSQTDTVRLINQKELEERNKKLATGFYNDLWFTNNTDNYKDYVADTYVAHDIGERKGVSEPAIEQKIIADRFWANGKWDAKINYQIAEGDLVATRWEATYQPETLIGRIMYGSGTIPIINVFRFQDGKIVELWNHRHDIDTNMTMKFTIKGLLIGLFIALIPTFFAIRLKRKLRKINLNN
ncbi:nuclear transport factor 2 family protein [Marivirga arenosa]|uniref:Ester cyclase n=1 Tax=Marivirga arenosa TaxID=3059076 RepID=A0AA52EZN7_9BACT|nr:ester cyclase [Marivirga sp. BKB1-2]WNB18681.1 ester cyclase [Marivirga sp. BKB1-2]